MPTVQLLTVIKASQNNVWSFISDIKKAVEWVEVMNELIETTDNPVQYGTVYKERSKIGPKESITEWKVTKFEPPSIQIHECSAPDFKAELTMVVEEKENKTRLIHTTKYQLLPVFRPLGWLFEILFIRRLMKNKLNASVKNLKGMIENSNDTQ